MGALKSDLKYWLRSGSWAFMRQRRTKGRNPFRPGQLATYAFHGHPIHYRPGSSDVEDIYEILLKKGHKAAYWVPQAIEPRVILDIGANIGLASIYLAGRFPQARIYSFEPLAENFALLRQNVQPYPAIHPVHAALGQKDEERLIYASDAGEGVFTGYSFFGLGVDPGKPSTVSVRNPAALLQELGVDQADLIKIDTEGAEWEILSSFDQDLLARAKWITGELHGVDDFKLLDHLANWFLIDVRKTLRKRLFEFHACSKSLAERIGPEDIRRLQY